MAITNKMLKEAIAEAETIRKVALENAKITLEEEQFTPAIKSMLAKQLRAEAEGALADDEEKEKKKAAPEPSAVKSEQTTEAAKEANASDVDPVGSSEMPADSSTVGTGDNKEPSADASDSSDIGPGPEEGDGDNSNGWYEDWNEGEFDLDEIIRELEEDVAKLGAVVNENEDKAKEEYPDADPVSSKQPPKPAEPQIKKEADDESEKEKPEAPAAEKEPAAPAAPAPVTEPAAAPAAPAVEPTVAPAADAGADEEELDLEAVIRELEADGQPGQSDAMAAELDQLRNELAEYRKAFQLLRGKLQEVNLLNAKLFYTNRLVSKGGLTDEQKVAIFENLDRAVDVRGVKMVYTALVETLSATAKTLKTRTAKKAITEGLASRAIPSTAPKAELIVEESALAKRFKELAGIL